MARVPDGGSGPSRTFGERTVYNGPEVRVGEVDVGLPDGERVWREVVHLFQSASVVLMDDQDRVLLLRRHRFVSDRWGWELPGGLVDEDEEPLDAATRDVEDQAGYRAGQLERLVSFELAPDAVDGEHVIFVGRAAEHLGDVIGADGIARSEWVRLETVPAMIAAGDVWASATLIGLLHVLAQQR